MLGSNILRRSPNDSDFAPTTGLTPLMRVRGIRRLLRFISILTTVNGPSCPDNMRPFASNTGPALIIRAEGKTEAVRDRYMALVKEALSAYPEIKWEED